LLSNTFSDYLQEGYTVQRTGKAAAIRLTVPAIDFRDSFDDHLEEIKLCFNAMQKMNSLVKVFDAELIGKLVH
jgi:hypothetical protein